MKLLLLISIIVALGALWLYRTLTQSKAEKEAAHQRELHRQKLSDFFKSKIGQIKKANKSFAKSLDFKTGYFSVYQLMKWKDLYAFLFDDIGHKSFQNIQLNQEEVDAITTFQNHFRNAIDFREKYNTSFIQEELKSYSGFFDNVENGRKLDLQQRLAVITDEDNNIVIAGAGSGKTTTIVGKVNYVIDRYRIAPEDILLISFTNESANELAKRIKIEGVEAKTFHKFGKDIVVETEGKQPSVFDEAQFKLLLTRYFTELLKDPNYLVKVTEYFTNFLKPVKSQFEFENQGEYIQYLKDQNFRTYKLKEFSGDGKKTFKMEVVKSIEECRIANFLLFNGVKYEYEFPYELDTATEKYKQYKPDFTVIQNNKKVYIEHFGINRDGTVPDWFSSDGIKSATEKYQEGIEWKRNLHATHGTYLIESYSYEMREEILFDNLSKKLTEAGITLHPKSPEEIWKIISEAAKEEVDKFISLFATFITLMKSNNYSIEDVINKSKQGTEDFTRQRNALFIEIISPILDRYESRLAERNEIDFSDMINKASFYIQSGKYKRKFKYIIIDEFQDISIGRYQLVKALKNRNPACKLFCVGDDWQSIYRFSGSDIALFKEFEKYFGFTVKSKIETTYRFSEPLLSLSSEFIQRNPNQARKELKSCSASKRTEYHIRYSMGESQNDTIAVQQVFNELINNDEEIGKKKILVLGRYKRDLERIKNGYPGLKVDKSKDTITYETVLEDGTAKKLEAHYKTVHKAKGLEGDIIIVINCNSGKYGFPSEMSDDQVLNLLLSEADQFENGEERRLFYVAMTRAKEQIYLIADSSFKSKFITELETESEQISPNRKCPHCKTADIILKRSGVTRKGNTYKFYGCTNYLYGCDYTTTGWINENSGTIAN